MKIYDTKFFGGITFEDKWNLREHPLFLKVDKKVKPYIRISEDCFVDGIKVDSLHAITTYLRKYDWTAEPKHWDLISHKIEGFISIPFT